MATALPKSFIESLRGVTGFDEAAFIRSHEGGHALTSVRLNPAKASETTLTSLPISRAVPWCAKGFHLSTRPSFTLDPTFHAGAYYVQEASSMFLEVVLKQHASLNDSLIVLDSCAAPGGKSTHLQSLISENSLLVSNEVIKTRVPILAQNIIKWGASNVVITSNDPRDFQRLGAFFDVMVVDAPCSGSGLFRKDPDAISHWNTSLVDMCASRQERILQDLWPALKPGGLLIYSTCSYSMEEDEKVLDTLINQHQAISLQVITNPDWGIVETLSPIHQAYGYRFYPDKIEGEGFFIAALQKNNDVSDKEINNRKLKHSQQQKKQSPILKQDLFKPFLKMDDNIVLLPWMKEILAIRREHIKIVETLQLHCYIKKAGINIGMQAHNELIPSHELALSHLLDENVPFIELDLENALQFLRLNAFHCQESSKGWKTVRNQGCNLGWVKVLPNRINNYYPRDWRILNK